MYIENWESFMNQAESLFLASPLRTRISTKYRNCDGKLVLKVTDNTTCLQYRTQQQSDIKHVEKFTAMFFALTATGKAPTGDMMTEAKLPAAPKSRSKN
ncbi:hypothetical protein H632_c868p1 [Helicosporidium sp. ATCC 50920]|nr:hypothetical protein H632_c868p1 [Helicosporidium sp. ATCC 50920]|eukprot:KDD75106.1 hypothetical protein H632_c868p1 [Helicosporidium sp. ATCC 50920]